MTNDIQTDLQQRKFKSDLLHELDRIASALERLAEQWEECEYNAISLKRGSTDS